MKCDVVAELYAGKELHKSHQIKLPEVINPSDDNAVKAFVRLYLIGMLSKAVTDIIIHITEYEYDNS